MIRVSAICVLSVSVLCGFQVAGCSDPAGGCSYDTDCPGAEMCVDGECVPNRCPEVPCDADEVCIDGECYLKECDRDADCPPGHYCSEYTCLPVEAGVPGTHTFTAGGASLSSENYRFELFIAPVCPVGDLHSANHRLRLGPGAFGRTGAYP